MNDMGPPIFDAPPILDVQGLQKRFVLHGAGGRTIDGLRGVDLRITEGEHVALAGLSGAGKSSLLKCVHRTYVADAGQIRYRTRQGNVVDLAALGDQEVADLREREIGYVSQFLRAEPRRNVIDVVARAARRLGADEILAQHLAEDVLRRVNITPELWHTFPTLLSGGEKQRVNLAVGIVVPPRLLLLDEPVSALDPQNRAAVLGVIDELTSKGATVLSVFHDLDAIRQLADRVVVLVEGVVVDEGGAAAVLDRSLSLATS